MKQPWHRKGRGWYYTDDQGKQQPLAQNKKEAFDLWHKIVAVDERAADGDPLFSELVAAYLKFAKRQIRNGGLTQKTLDDYAWYIDKFFDDHEDLHVSELQPRVLTDWLNGKETWGNAGQRGAITAIGRVLSWARREKRIKENPLEFYEKPPQNRRENLVERDLQREMIMAVRNAKYASTADRQFQLVLAALTHCGGRPQDVSNVRVEHVDKDVTTWMLPDHKRYRHTRKPKVVVLSPCLATITRMVKSDRTEGPLFRGRRGQLSVNAIGCRIKRLKKTLGAEVIAYDYRHTYITDALQAGEDAATVAELTGTSVQMIERHYGHLCKRRDHLRSSAARIAKKRKDLQ